MDIKVGEYVRTKRDIIGTLKSQELTYPEPNEWILDINGKKVVIVECDDYPVDHSFNLIDLINEKDLIEYQVNSLSKLKVGRVKKYRDARSNSEYLGVEGFDITKIYIQSILTHKLFEANAYKVKGE